VFILRSGVMVPVRMVTALEDGIDVGVWGNVSLVHGEGGIQGQTMNVEDIGSGVIEASEET